MTTTPRSDDTAQIPWAQTQTFTYAAQPASPPEPPLSTPTTAPALDPPTWTGRKTAITAALAIGGCPGCEHDMILPALTPPCGRRTPRLPHLPQLGAVRARGDHAAYPNGLEAVQRKDFSAVPLCGSMRPLTSQRVLLAPPASRPR